MDFPLPPVGEGLLEVELVRWMVNPGDVVHPGQSLMEVLSDKATMEVPAPFAGRIETLSAVPGSKIGVGQVVLTYSPMAAEASSASGGGSAGASSASLATGLTTSSAVAAALSRPPNPSSASEPPANGPSAPLAPPLPTATGAPLPPASPSVRHLARRFGIDLTRIRGSGPHGRILLDDLTPFLTRPTAPEPPPAPPAAKTATPPLDLGTPGTTIKLAGIRRKIAEHMLAAKKYIPHYSYIDECNFTELVQLRDQLREPCQKQGIKLTYLAFFVKAVARALKEVPMVNASFDETREEATLHDYYHIGIAVAARAGLVVPVIRDADRKNLFDIAREIDRLSSEVKAGRARIEDLRGGTFTITSIGNIGGLISTPIINHPEVGILGVGKVVKRPVFDAQGHIRPADIVYLSFSFDHRIVDGAIGAIFGNAVIRQLQRPAELLIGD